MMTPLAAAYAHGPGKIVSVGPTPETPATPGERQPLPAGSAVAQLIAEVLTPARWEPWNQYNDHRAYPSPRAAYLVDVDIVVNGRHWTIDAARRSTIGPDVPPLENEVRLEFIRRPDRLPSGYGEFVHALVELEIGHIAAALVENSTRLALRAIADGNGVSLRPGGSRQPGSVPRRSSGIGPRGLSADPRPLPQEALTAFVKSIRRLPAGTLAHSGLHHRLAVHNVTGMPDGWYTVDPFELVTPNAAMDTVQRCHGHPQAVMDVSGLNLALIITADIPAVVATEGPGAYHALLRAAGSLAQHACTASARAAMFCRPLRSFDDPVLEAAAGTPMADSLLYVLLAGRPRVTGFPYDLSPLETR